MKRLGIVLMLLASSVLLFPACNASRKTKGAIIGATAGGAAGGVIAKKNKAVWIIAGAALGGVAGGLIGDYMDKQAEEIEQDLEGATVERVGEGILITFDSGILFDFDSYALKSETRSNLSDLSETLNKYEDTDVLVLGHTDNVGTDQYNQGLSEKRANSVKSFLITQQVASSRLSTEGYGETDPIATNETEEGRQLNRRVEIVVVANKKLQRAAKKGDLAGAD
jgi:outer membrane protein OmpA-like peptidoglycan-associated protein